MERTEGFLMPRREQAHQFLVAGIVPTRRLAIFVLCHPRLPTRTIECNTSRFAADPFSVQSKPDWVSDRG